MDESRKLQVSLRGASAKEISRDQLLEKVSAERELRNFTRRANVAALFIQRVWRRYIAIKRYALQLQQEWELLLVKNSNLMSKTWICSSLLRPFLFFITHLSTHHQKIVARDGKCICICFKILLESSKSADPNRNFCSMVIDTIEEKRVWLYQAKKLISLCAFVLLHYVCSCSRTGDIFSLVSLALRLVITLSDARGWKCISVDLSQDANGAVKDVIRFMGSGESGLYRSIGIYIMKLDACFPSQKKSTSQMDDKFLITASTINIALRPFQVFNFDATDPVPSDLQHATEQYSMFILPIPYLARRIPTLLLTALRHRSVLVPCFRSLLMVDDITLIDYSGTEQEGGSSCHNTMPPVAWAFSNIVCLATEGENESADATRFTNDVDCISYVHVLNHLAEKLLAGVERFKSMQKDLQESHDAGYSAESDCKFIHEADTSFGSLRYMDLLRPICQQWHLSKLMTMVRKDALGDGANDPQKESGLTGFRSLELLHIAYLYSHMIRLYSVLNSTVGSLPVLNMLSFTPGFLTELWEALEPRLFPGKVEASQGETFAGNVAANTSDTFLDVRRKQTCKDAPSGVKWVNVLHKITGKSQANADSLDLVDRQSGCSQSSKDVFDLWDVEFVRCGPQSMSSDMSCQLHLFCATYAHLLLVLDDIEFYQRQVPFSLEQQRKIAAMLNTLVYNGLHHNCSKHNTPLMDAAIRCLQMLYERDCRHSFCPSALWLSPARKSRPSIAAAARTHEALSIRSDDSMAMSSMTSVITTTPHVYPFEERVQMFREFIKMDKTSRRMAGEMIGPGERSIEIVVRRDHIVEDGFQQLNSLGSRLKSSIHVSFVSECGLSEAGLDYGGLSKEFLTDIVKAAFSPEYGLFTQTSTSERLLIPNTAARFQENGIQMIEFLGRIVGKALYEEILLDYSFSHVFVQKLLGRYSFLDELSTLDPELYKNLMYVKHYDGDAKDLTLDFTVTEESFGRRQIIELRPGGKDTSVTNENKLQYIHAIADFKLNRQILPSSNAFYRGLTDLIAPSWLKLFNASEFNQLLSGGNRDIDVDDLRHNTRYTGGYSEGSRTIKLFWEVMTRLEPNERCMLLKFVTSCSRAPLLGFKHLHPTFTIHKVACDVPLWASIGGQDVDRLPSASTCYNTLKLPTYKRASTLKAKLLYAINSNAGFELS